MLPGGYWSVLHARDREEFRDEVVRFTRRLGFETYTAMAVVDRSIGQSDFVSVHNTPSGYEDVAGNPASYRRDPVMQHCKRHSVPIIWDREVYADHGAAELWEEQARYGYHTGIAMALHLPEGQHFLFGVDRDRALPDDAVELQRIVADLQLFAVHAQAAAQRLLLPPAQQSERPALTPRELESLRWTMDGKTAWEVGAILGITERTAVLHVNSAMHKLGCVNKHQAVLKALKLGLIH